MCFTPRRPVRVFLPHGAADDASAARMARDTEREAGTSDDVRDAAGTSEAPCRGPVAPPRPGSCARDHSSDVPGSSPQDQDEEQQRVRELDLKVARRMFWWGFALLPGLWLLVWVHFRQAVKQPGSDPLLRLYVHRSLVGATCSGVLLACWVALVQSHWREWEDRWQSLMAVAPPPEETDW